MVARNDFDGPARFVPVGAHVNDYAFVSSNERRALLGRVFRRIANGQVIAPPRVGWVSEGQEDFGDGSQVERDD